MINLVQISHPGNTNGGREPEAEATGSTFSHLFLLSYSIPSLRSPGIYRVTWTGRLTIIECATVSDGSLGYGDVW